MQTAPRTEDTDRRDLPEIEPAAPTMGAWSALAVVLIALTLGALLNAGDMLATAERQEFGWKRRVALAVVEPIAGVSRAIGFDEPRRAVELALGREVAEEEPEVIAQPEPAPPVEGAGAEPSPDASATAEPEPTPSPSPTPTGTERVVTAQDPLIMYIGGDSMVGQFGPMLQNEANKSGVVTAEFQYEFESGLTRPDFIDWPARLREIRAGMDPDVMVLFFGGNDAQPLKLDGVVYEPEAPQWQAEYRTRVKAVMAELAADGRHVYWMGMPIARDPKFSHRMEILNEIYRSEAEAHDLIEFVPSWDLFAGPDGNFSEYLPNEDGDVVDMRLNDGIHLTTAGAIRLAKPTFARIAEDWDLPLPE